MPSQHAWWICESLPCMLCCAAPMLPTDCRAATAAFAAIHWCTELDDAVKIQHCHACSLKRVHGKCPKELKDHYECLDYYR